MHGSAALLHHVDLNRLRAGLWAIDPRLRQEWTG